VVNSVSPSIKGNRKIYPLLKHLIDILFAFIILTALAPLFILLALTIKLASPHGSIFYGHERLGRQGKQFLCWKFRTMCPHADLKLHQYLELYPQLKIEFETSHKLKDDPRIIKGVGHFLRATSMDELPQFFNVLLGQMSTIGPRPITTPELSRYHPYEDILLSVAPGITGLWQVSGRNNVSYEQRVKLDLTYIKNKSFKSDFTIFLKTFPVIIKHKGY
jgi:lipopolysaccharide/colanic/teichoic acid biosynthesis glycosyltransferase